MRWFALAFFFLPCLASARSTASGFDFSRDTFAFQNETYFTYNGGQPVAHRLEKGKKIKGYTRQCFSVARASIQFFKFARFDPAAPEISPEELTRRVRQICRIPVWFGKFSTGERVVIPGYASLREFSAAETLLLQANIGKWWASYVRFGNYRLPLPFPRLWQRKAAEELRAAIEKGDPQAVYMMRLAWLNHNIVLFDVTTQPNGDIDFLAYDPNLNDQPRVLSFRNSQRVSRLLKKGETKEWPGGNSQRVSRLLKKGETKEWPGGNLTCGFEFPETFYFRGGPVNIFRTYISPFH